MKMRIPLSNCSLTDAERLCVTSALKEGMISGTGDYVNHFQLALERRIKRYALPCANGTLALELVLRTLGIGPGMEVIVPALTFVAPAAVVKAVGATPIFVDIDPVSWTLDPAQAWAKVNKRTEAVIAVDLLGHPADFDALEHLFPNLPLIEDAAQAHGAQYKGSLCGSFGRFATFSFHANKAITCGEGGAVTYSSFDDGLDMQRRLNHGMTRARPYWHTVVGSNYRLNNLSAAIGYAQMGRWEELIGGRNAVAQVYSAGLPAGFTPRPVADWATPSTWLYAVSHPERDRIVPFLRQQGIDARAIWPALVDLPPYRDEGDYPIARRVSAETFWLPTYHGMSARDQETVLNALHHAVAPIS